MAEPSSSPDNALAVAASSKMLGIATPMMSIPELLAFRDTVTKYVTQALRPGVDYGVVPGTKKKTLLKPGAETLCLAFGVTPTFESIEKEVDHRGEYPWKKIDQDWKTDAKSGKRYKAGEIEKTGTSIGLYRYHERCTLKNLDGRVIGTGEGICSTRETKYLDRPQDVEHTVMAMAQKRAWVRAVVNAFGLTDRFDVESDDEPDNNQVRGTAPEQGGDRTYEGSSRDQATLFEHLKSLKIPERDWIHFHIRLKGKLESYCVDLVDEYHKRGHAEFAYRAAESAAEHAGVAAMTGGK
jgi:hypothetical protein